MGFLEEGKEYHGLSIRDLLEARDAYHVFLMRKKNVIGTAIGRYRVRRKDADKQEPKTLYNTKIQGDKSWPCVMVFVKDWISEEEFKKPGASNDDYLPQCLYLPDGREIPVCVIKADWGTRGPDVIPETKFPGSVIGGGYPVFTRVQGQERWATFGCLVTDGRLIYGLTSAHAAGRPGETVFTLKNGNEDELGVASSRQIQKRPFSKVYETLPGKHVLVNLDAGLIELDDLHAVTSRVYGLEEIRGLADVNHDTLSLKLIGCPVLGFGCVSGSMQGEILCLFYRYSAGGGYDYVTDYLVGPRYDAKTDTFLPFYPRPGDSGTLLVIDAEGTDEHMKAIGILWGGQRDVGAAGEQPYGLVTNLGTICRELDVELVSGWNTAYDRYFGAYAHVVLPSLCASAIQDEKLKTLMSNNSPLFSMPLGETPVSQTKGLSKAPFVPLSDVPDLVWKSRGGKFMRSREGANHFADMDQPNPAGNNQTLLDLCRDPANVDPDVWVNYYKQVGAREKGSLPFRIAQIYDAMEGSVAEGDVAAFVGAAGILMHYVFDACMPLHISYLHHGDPNGPMQTVHQGGKEKQIPIAYDVHAEFDNEMVEYNVDEISRCLPDLVKQKALADDPISVDRITSAKDAALAAVSSMRDTVEKYVNPTVIVEDYEELCDRKKRERCDALWAKHGGGMQQAMAEAAVLAARLWEAAWHNGNGDQTIQTLDAVAQDDLRKLYETKTGFLDSVNLEDIKSTMHWSDGHACGGNFSHP